jgi:chromosome segregation ATPase
LDQVKRSTAQTIKVKQDEINQMGSSQRAFEESFKNQSETLRMREEKIAELSEEVRSLQLKSSTLEAIASEVHSIKEKNKKYFDLLTSSNNDLNALKIEVQTLLHERNDILVKNGLIEKEYNSIREEFRKYQDKYNETAQNNEQYKSEIRLLKHELDILHEKYAMKHKEAK